MIVPQRRLPVLELAAIATAAAVGAALSVDVGVALALWIAVMGLFALTIPATYWVVTAVVSAVLLRGLITLGVLPTLMTFVDIPLAWGALIVALLSTRSVGQVARRIIIPFGSLVVAIAVSWFFHPSELLRPVLYLLLLGEPFVLVLAMVLDPPSPRAAAVTKRVLIACVAIQVPIGFLQFASFGTGGGEGNLDHVQGTLFGAGAGHVAMATILVIGAIWLLSDRRIPTVFRVAFAAPLFLLVFFADAKQVLFALPATLVALRFRGHVGQAIVKLTAVATVLFVLVTIYPAGRVALSFIQGASEDRGGKLAVAEMVVSRVKEDPTTLAFGTGPATTVSRASFMTTDLFLRGDSPLRVLGLRPSEFALQANERALQTSTGVSSFNSATSSALGVLGDIGIVGAFAYLSLLLTMIVQLRRVVSPIAAAAAAGWGLFTVLGFVFDWWEQPPLAVFLGALSGLALAAPSSERSIV